jgi:hypothetical protein
MREALSITTMISIWPYIRLLTYGLVDLALLVMLIILIDRFIAEQDPLGHIPGPFLARWTPIWIAYHARRGRRYLAVAEAHKVSQVLLSRAPLTLEYRNTALSCESRQIISQSRIRMPFRSSTVRVMGLSTSPHFTQHSSEVALQFSRLWIARSTLANAVCSPMHSLIVLSSPLNLCFKRGSKS